MKLLIAIPALNEEQSIASTVQRCLAARDVILANSPVTGVEVTVVSDGSTDRTIERAREFGGLINLIAFTENQGYGAAIMSAWSQSEADLLGFLDADGTCDPRFFATLCRQLVERRADMALGCRLNAESRMPLIRRIGNTLFAQLLSTLSSKTVRDTASGMRVVRRTALRHLYPLPVGLHFTPAMSARAMLSGATSIVEIDMPYAEREGQSKLRVIRDGFRFLNAILSNALLYKPGRILSWSGLACVTAGGALMAGPALHYVSTRSVAEWMIYRMLVSLLCWQVAVLLFGGAILNSRAARLALGEEAGPSRTQQLDKWLRSRWGWGLASALAFMGAMLLWPSLVERWNTAHTNAHWSRFVLAIGLFGTTASLLVFRAMGRLVDMAEERFRYLASPGK